MTSPLPTPHPAVRFIATGIFNEKRGYRIVRPRGTDDWLMIYTTGGIGRFGYGNQDLAVRANDIVLLKPGTPHDYGIENTSDKWDLIWAHFNAPVQWLARLDWPAVAPGLMHLHINSQSLGKKVVTRLRQMHALAQGSHRLREELALNALDEALLWCDEANPRCQQARLDDRIRQTMEFACQHLSDRLSLDGLAESAGLSVSRLAHLFREQTGLTPQNYVEQQRLTRACQLLQFTSKSVKEISSQVGFQSPFYFTLRFKRATGQSPRAWRAGHGTGTGPRMPGRKRAKP